MNIGLLIKQSGFSKSCDGTDSYVGDYEDFERLTKAIRAEALAEQEKQEPVAWHHPECEGSCLACLIEKDVQENFGNQGLNYLKRHIHTTQPSVEAMRIETLEKAAKGIIKNKHMFATDEAAESLAAAIKGMK